MSYDVKAYQIVEFYKNSSYESNEKLTLFTRSKMQDLEATAHANNTFKERIRSDIKEYRENTHKHINSTRKYFPSLLLIFLTEDRIQSIIQIIF